jgi:hypothetical protein
MTLAGCCKALTNARREPWAGMGKARQSRPAQTSAPLVTFVG